MLTRWEKWYSEDNLIKDPRILAAPPSQCAGIAAAAFLERRKQRILDLGCGIGRDTFYLQSCGLAVTGVDASFNGVRTAKQIGSQKSASSAWVTADARRLPFQDGSFEGIYCFGLLHEFTAENKALDVEQVMSEVRRVLDEAGLLVLAVLAGDPQAGLPAVQLFNRQMFENVAQSFRQIEIRDYNDVGCTGRADYQIWLGIYEKS